MSDEIENAETTPATPDASATEATPSVESASDAASDPVALMTERFNKLAGVKTEARPEAEPEAKVEGKEAAKGKDAPSAKGETPAVDAAKLEKAKAALKRWQYSPELIAALSPDELIERGEKAAKTQAEQDRVGNETHRLRTMLAEIEAERAAKAGTAQTPAQQTAPTHNAQPQTDPSDPVATLMAALNGDELYQPIAGPLQAALAAIERRAVDATHGELSKRDAELQRLDAERNRLYLQIDQMHLDSARKELAGQFPKLKDSTVFQQVRTRVYELAKLDGYRDETGTPDWARLVTDAARLEGLDHETKQEQQAKLIDRQRRQLEGQTQDAHERRAPSGSLDPHAAMKKAIRELGKGKRPSDVRDLIASASTD